MVDWKNKMILTDACTYRKKNVILKDRMKKMKGKAKERLIRDELNGKDFITA